VDVGFLERFNNLFSYPERILRIPPHSQDCRDFFFIKETDFYANPLLLSRIEA